jgi:hypothetical protein
VGADSSAIPRQRANLPSLSIRGIFQNNRIFPARVILNLLNTSNNKEKSVSNRSRTFPAAIYVTTTALASPCVAMAEGRIEVSLSNPTVPDPSHPATVSLRIENTGDKPVSIMKWDTPFVGLGGRLAESIFQVKDENGNEVFYGGSWAYFGRLTTYSFTTLYPGQRLEKDLDIGREYRFKPNSKYRIRYVLNLTHQPDADVTSSAERSSFFPTAQSVASSGEVSISIGDSAAPRGANTADSELKCDASQTLTIARVRLATTRRLTTGESFLCERYVPTIENGHMRYVFKSHPRYTRSFGTHDDSEPDIYSEGWGLNNNARVFETAVSTAKRAFGSDQNVRCGRPDVTDERVAAHVDTESTYTMVFCDRFFNIPEFDVIDSQVGARVDPSRLLQGGKVPRIA